jgi:hypothetical protein
MGREKGHEMTEDRVREALEALREFVSDINVTGGVVENPDGTYSPAADEDWVDLGQTYMRACEALGLTPETE